MNDTQRSPRPATRSPRRSGKASTQLGELEFSEWYEIPVFEQDDDERIEELATAGRGPRRLMARAKLAVDARRAQRQPRWDSPAPRQPAPPPTPAPAARATTPPVATAKAPAPPVPQVEAPARAAPQVEAPAPPVAEAPAPLVTEAPAPPAAEAPARVVAEAPAPPAAEAPPAPAPPKRTQATAARVDTPAPAPATGFTPPAAADEDTWMTSGPALTEESMQHDLDHENVWRRRLNQFLDRWAANEVAVAHRLDDSLERVMSSNIPKAIPDLLAAATKRGGSR